MILMDETFAIKINKCGVCYKNITIKIKVFLDGIKILFSRKFQKSYCQKIATKYTVKIHVWVFVVQNWI
jgi:hypothetical protein